MELDETCIEGCQKKILFASPMQISGFRKKYLRSLSPSQGAKVFRQSLNQPYNMQDLMNKLSSRRVPKSREAKRTSSINVCSKPTTAGASLNNKRRFRKIVFKETLRLNNL